MIYDAAKTPSVTVSIDAIRSEMFNNSPFVIAMKIRIHVIDCMKALRYPLQWRGQEKTKEAPQHETLYRM